MKRLRLIGEELSGTTAREAVQGVLRGYHEHDVLTFASAIAFQVLFATIPLALFGIGLLGGFGLEEQWTRQWAAQARDSMSPAAFGVVDDTVRRVLGERQLFWTSAGALIAVWKISSATRAVMEVFDRIYGSHRQRSFAENIRVSLVLGTAVGMLVLASTACAVLGDDALRAAGIESPAILWLRLLVSLALLFAVVALLVAWAPVDRQPLQWVTFGSLTVVSAWVGTSLVLGWYLTSIADYGSVFGALATVVVVLTYLYLASAAFLTGAEIDARLRARVEGRC
ncbi:MAG: YihY/virulence factor BrkB family protein [Actinomycetota bacterium]|nr:YihY/virulence factor BrkB family protein [Actinomycetota bacterium]